MGTLDGSAGHWFAIKSALWSQEGKVPASNVDRLAVVWRGRQRPSCQILRRTRWEEDSSSATYEWT